MSYEKNCLRSFYFYCLGKFIFPSNRPGDVLSVLEMVWINWAGPMSHLISDMGGEFVGELGEFMSAHGFGQYLPRIRQCTFSVVLDPWFLHVSPQISR